MKKLLTGIAGFDEITGGGLPVGRPTLVAGGPGCGKSLFALSVVANAAGTLDIPCAFMSFEESQKDIEINSRSIGIDLVGLQSNGKLIMDFAGASDDTPQEIGNYTLDGLMIRLQSLIDENGAQVVAIDTIETLYSLFKDKRIIRRELARLFRWCKERTLTLIITGEAGRNSLTRFGLEEYVSDCVIYLSHTVNVDVSTRRLRVVKYRGAKHGTNEFPFIIEDDGLHVMPITAAELDHKASTEFSETGIARLDQMLGGQGLRCGSTVLVTGQPGSGKTSFAMTLAAAGIARGERVVYFSFEESPSELSANVSTIGIELEGALKSGQLVLNCARPTLRGLEHHLVSMYKTLDEQQPSLAIVDPISGLYSAGTRAASYRTLIRLVDTLRSQHITVLATLSHRETSDESSDYDIAPIADVWIQLECGDEPTNYRRTIEVVKARGTDHERGLRAFRITSDGINIDAEQSETQGS